MAKDAEVENKTNCSKICGCFIRGEQNFKDCLEAFFFQHKAGRYLERLSGVLMLSSSIVYVTMSYMSD